MRYKILLTGKNNAVINDFFAQLDERIDSLTTSMRWEDIINHMKYFEPDAFCYCINNESLDNINKMVSLKPRLEEKQIPLIVVGSEEDCSEFEKTAVRTADLILPKPLKAAEIEEYIIKYLEEREFTEDAGGTDKEGAKTADKERTAEKVQIPLEGQTAEKEKKTGRKHILVVDDSVTMLKAIKEHLHEHYDVATAISGKVAMKFLEKKKTDLILLDYEMPEENGPEVLQKLRANEATKNLPVIFLTGITERKKIEKALVLRPQGYLLKPVDHEKLLAVIGKALGEGENGK